MVDEGDINDDVEEDDDLLALFFTSMAPTAAAADDRFPPIVGGGGRASDETAPTAAATRSDLLGIVDVSLLRFWTYFLRSPRSVKKLDGAKARERSRSFASPAQSTIRSRL